jgi:hypothetical protein
MNLLFSRAFSIFIIIFSVYSFLNANMDFSYDYSAYIFYTNNAVILDFTYLNKSLFSFLPLPYVLVPPSATLEYAYVAATVFFGYFGLSSPAIYAAIGSSSIALRAYVLHRAKAGFLLNFLLALCFITLFEANALRAGAASSIVLVSIMLFVNKHYAWSAVLLVTSCFMHIQSIIYVLTFLAGLGIYVITIDKPYRRISLILLGTALTFVAIPLISAPFGEKIDGYMLRASSDNRTTGLNVVTVLSLIIIGTSLYALPRITKFSKGTHSLVWISSLFAFSQSTIFLIFGDAFADIGVRLWQFSFLIFVVASTFLSTSLDKSSLEADSFKYTMRFIYLCTLAQAINVIIRYPLSNFFYPFLPYNPIDYIKF